MGREVRRVPANYKHPKNEYGNYAGLFDGFNRAVKHWEEDKEKWEQGLERDYHNNGWKPFGESAQKYGFEEWCGERPLQENYMPDFPSAERTHLMMFETCSEGSPISPVFATPEELARWLADNGASSFGNMTATYEQWLRVCKGGFAPSAIVEDGVMKSGVEALYDITEKGN